MQVSPTNSAPPPTTAAWVERPDLAGSRVEWESAIGRQLSLSDLDLLADAVVTIFDGNADGAISGSEATRRQEWIFASDAAGSDAPQFLYSHSTIRQEVVTISALRDAAAGADGIASRAEVRDLLGTLDLSNGGLPFHELGPTIVAARQVTVPGRLAGAFGGHLIVDDWQPER